MVAVIRKANIDRISKLVRKSPGRLHAKLEQSFRESAAEWDGAMQKRFRAPLSLGSNANSTLHSRSGGLRRSLQYKVTGNKLGQLKLKISSVGVPYARLQEFGGKITPKKAKFLTIPLPDNMTDAGVMKVSARAAIRGGASFMWSKKSKQWLIVKRGAKRKIRYASGLANRAGTGPKRAQRTGKIEFLFVLKKSVYIPPRLGFFSTWTKQQPRRSKRNAVALASALRGKV